MATSARPKKTPKASGGALSRSREMLAFPTAWASQEKNPHLFEVVENSARWARDAKETWLSSAEPDAAFEEVEREALSAGNKGLARSARAVLDARSGVPVKIPRLAVGAEAIAAYLEDGVLDGWLYQEFVDAHGEHFFIPSLVTEVSYDPGKAGPGADHPRVAISLLQVDVTDKESRASTPTSRRSKWFEASDITNKTAAEALMAKGLFHETAELRAAYDEYVEGYRQRVLHGFAQQYFADKIEFRDPRTYDRSVETNVRVVQDTRLERGTSVEGLSEFDFLGEERPVPVNPTFIVFDLLKHEYHKVFSMALKPYVYTPEIKDKLVLPAAHKDLLDVLTTDLEMFTSDVIAGKTSGNVILAKGIPGVGKTLTAEVYSEIVKRPLYAVQSGELGTDAAGIRTSLEKVFKRAKRWNAVLLLDEADVFVRERGNDIQHNAIVAEFLRTLEYFDGLLFMTTNRDDSIDEAIVSRCAAIISYGRPAEEDAKKIWRVLADAQGVALPEGMEVSLWAHLPKASPRDIKMVLRLAARMAVFHSEELGLDHFRQASMFRGVTWEEPKQPVRRPA